MFFDPGGLPRGFLPEVSADEEAPPPERGVLGFAAAERGLLGGLWLSEEESEVGGWWDREIAPP